jgi:hypothetical protein
MPTKTIDGSAYGAFAVLKDGKWHSADELRRRCGEKGVRRARHLREAKFGGFTLERTRDATGTSYRLLLGEIRGKKLAVTRLEARLPCLVGEEVDDVDKVLVLSLPACDVVFLLALLENSAQLRNPEVKKLWDQRRSQLAFLLKEALPDGVRDPFDLFEQEDDH